MLIKKPFDGNKLFFTSDLHFYHQAIINFSDRPYYDVFDMNQKLIDNWNLIVDDDDDIFVAGDFIMSGNIELTTEIVKSLKGKIYLALGNHDYGNRLYRNSIKSLFYEVDDMFYITVNDDTTREGKRRILVSHYPLESWARGYYNLHGHIHSKKDWVYDNTDPEKIKYLPKRYDVGVDNNNYYPVYYKKIAEIFNDRIIEQ